MKWAPAILFLFLALAGCAADEPAAQNVEEPTAPTKGPGTNENLGAVQGLVVDDSFAPIANATAKLETPDINPKVLGTVTTNEGGEFTFELLEPGAYRVRIEAPQYPVTAQLAQVVAGEVAELRFTLTILAGQSPYVEVKVFQAAAGCDSVGAVVTFAVVGDICPAAPAETGYRANISESWRHAVWEVTWDAPEEYLGFLITDTTFTCDTEPCYAVTVGPPPLRLIAIPGQKTQEDSPFFNAPTGSIKAWPEGAFETAVGGYHGGMFGGQTTTAMEPTGYCPENCYGVATTVERKFTIYESIFHFAPPPNPDAYSALADA